jgi:hypothetical protein
VPAPSDDFESADDGPLRAVTLAAAGLMSRMRVQMRKSRRFGFLLNFDGKPTSLPQLARIAGCATDEVRPLVQELMDTGSVAMSGEGTFFSPRMVAYESFRKKCGRAGRKGGGNPALRRGRDKPLTEGLKVGPDGFPSHSSSFPPGKCMEEAVEQAREGDADRAKRLANARTFATHWIRQNHPDRLRDGVRPFAELVALLGEDLAVQEVETVSLDPDVKNPFAVAWSNHDPKRRQVRSRNGNARPYAPANGLKTFEDVKREKQDAAVDEGLKRAIGGAW